MRRTAFVLAALSALLSACASPPINYYTLLGPSGPGQEGGQPSSPAGVAAVQVLPVSLPAELDLPQILVRSGQGQVEPLDSDRWAGPLDDQLRAALADQLSRRLGVPVVQSPMPAGDADRLWRVQVEVRRFESEPGQAALLDAVWWAAPAQSRGPSPLCHVRYRSAVAPGIPELVGGHQQNVAQLSQAIAAVISSGKGQGLRCP